MKPKLFSATFLAVMIACFGYGHATANIKANGSFPVLKAAEKNSVHAKKDVVKLYPNPSTNGRVTVSSNTAQTLHFYVFSLDGTLLHQVILKDREKKIINNLEKGTYVYDAFLNDEGIDHGNIIVK